MSTSEIAWEIEQIGSKGIDETIYSKKEEQEWGIKRAMIKNAGYTNYNSIEDVDDMVKDVLNYASNEINQEVVIEPEVGRFIEYILTEDGLWTTSYYVRPESRLMVLHYGELKLMGLRGEHRKYSIKTFTGKILLGIGIKLGKSKYLRGIYEEGNSLKTKTQPYELTYKDGLRYKAEMKTKELEGIQRVLGNALSPEGSLKWGEVHYFGDHISLTKLLRILNTVVELEGGLVTRYYSLIEVEDYMYKLVEEFTELGEEDRYKEKVVMEQELTEDTLITWNSALRRVDRQFKDLKRIEEHNEKMRLEQEKFDKARDYLPKYLELHDKYKDKLALNKVGIKLKKLEEINSNKLEELTLDFNKLSQQVNYEDETNNKNKSDESHVKGNI